MRPSLMPTILELVINSSSPLLIRIILLAIIIGSIIIIKTTTIISIIIMIRRTFVTVDTIAVGITRTDIRGARLVCMQCAVVTASAELYHIETIHAQPENSTPCVPELLQQRERERERQRERHRESDTYIYI